MIRLLFLLLITALPSTPAAGVESSPSAIKTAEVNMFPATKVDRAQRPRRGTIVVCSNIMDRVLPLLKIVAAGRTPGKAPIIADARQLPPGLTSSDVTFAYIGQHPGEEPGADCLNAIPELAARVKEAASDPRSAPGSLLCDMVTEMPNCDPTIELKATSTWKYWHSGSPSTVAAYVFLCFDSYDLCETSALTGLFGLELLSQEIRIER